MVEPASRRGSCRASMAFGLLLLTLAGCASDPDPGWRQVLRVGVARDSSPLVYRIGDEWAGVEVELARLAANHLGVGLRFVELDPRAQIAGLRSGRIDVVATTLPADPGRSRGIRFTQAYLRTGQIAMIRAADLARLEDPGTLAEFGARVGYVSDSPAREYVRRKLPGSAAYAFPGADDAIRSLRSHRIDFFIHDAPSLVYRASLPGSDDLLAVPRLLTREDFAWAVRRSNGELAGALDDFLDSAKSGGTLETVLDQSRPGRRPPAE